MSGRGKQISKNVLSLKNKPLKISKWKKKTDKEWKPNKYEADMRERNRKWGKEKRERKKGVQTLNIIASRERRK